MRKPFFVSVVIILMLTILAGCGVPQEEYDELERTAVEEIASLEEALDAALAEVEYYKGEVEGFGIEAADFEDQYENFSIIVQRMQLKAAIAMELFLPTFTGDDLDNASTIETVRGYVEELGDDVIKGKFDAWAASPSDRSLALELLEYVLEKLEEDTWALG